MNNETTYCPQDNKLRLYVGRVDRDAFLALRAEGWTSTPKQDCDFVATWTPEREDTALGYGGGIIGDEDQSPQDRAADRAERFAGYRDKRTAEAIEHADSYDNQPQAHGYQNAAKAERAAARHDRQGARAVSQWSKAEYWTTRTAGVISSALYKDLPAVRATRIKEIEKVARRTEGRTDERGQRWNEHCKLRLAYERQMIEAQGGMAEDLDIEAGGMFAGQLIHGITKSPATKRVSSVKIMQRARYGDNKGKPVLTSVKIERYGQDAYTPPTAETLQQLADIKAATKAAAKLAPKKPSLINPTLEQAQKLQDIWNAASKGEPQEVLQVSQGFYKARAAGSYARLSTKMICEGGTKKNLGYNPRNFPDSCKVRVAPPASSSTGRYYNPDRVIILTDKPQKAFPPSLFTDPRPALVAECSTPENAAAIVAHVRDTSYSSDIDKKLWNKAHLAGLVTSQSLSQKSLTEYGSKILLAAEKDTAPKQTPSATVQNELF